MKNTITTAATNRQTIHNNKGEIMMKTTRRSIKAVAAAVLLTAVSIAALALGGCSTQLNVPTEYKEEAPVATAAPAAAVSETAAPETAAPAQQNSTGITVDDAVSIALNDAGFSDSEVQITKKELDTDDGVQKYEISFLDGAVEYEYDINAQTGAILEKSRDIEND